jgi:hypothetical protein
MTKVNKNIASLALTLLLAVSPTFAGIIITNTKDDGSTTCTETTKVDSGIIITNLTGIIITNLTGIIITNATDEPTNCGIIITN